MKYLVVISRIHPIGFLSVTDGITFKKENARYYSTMKEARKKALALQKKASHLQYFPAVEHYVLKPQP